LSQILFWVSLILALSIFTAIALVLNPELFEQIRPSNN